jgi:hypothetical protein
MTPTEDLGLSTRRRNLWIAALVALAVVVAVVLVLVVTGGDDDSPGTSPGDAKDPVTPGSSKTPSSTPRTSPKASPSKTPNPAVTETGAVNPAKPQRVPFDQTAEPAEDVALSVTSIEQVKAKATAPGETSGPALRITMRVRNDKKVALPIGAAVTNLYYGTDRTPSNLVLQGSKAFPASVRPGAEATGVVIYRIPPNRRDKVTLEVILDNKLRVIEFSGGCPQDC